MAEGVVVELEAVQVEERKHQGMVLRCARDRALEVPCERPPVGQTGKRVRERLVTGDVKHLGVLTESEDQASPDSVSAAAARAIASRLRDAKQP